MGIYWNYNDGHFETTLTSIVARALDPPECSIFFHSSQVLFSAQLTLLYLFLDLRIPLLFFLATRQSDLIYGWGGEVWHVYHAVKHGETCRGTAGEVTGHKVELDMGRLHAGRERGS